YHWDGNQWSLVSLPNQATCDRLLAVSALAANNVWAVGMVAGSGFDAPWQTLVEHWNGTVWSIVPSPNLSYDNRLFAVTALGANDVWAVGGASATPADMAQTLIEHWDGSQWRVVPSPNAGGNNYLFGLAATAANDVWAVGYNATSWNQALILHWDG